MKNEINQPPPSLRPFNSQDFLFFGGVESESPQIGFHGEFAVSVDGTEIQIFQGEDFFRRSCKSEESATLIGNHILLMLSMDFTIEVICDVFQIESF